jgi:hypothetical protein
LFVTHSDVSKYQWQYLRNFNPAPTQSVALSRLCALCFRLVLAESSPSQLCLCFYSIMVTTRKKNKDAHPGYVDRGESGPGDTQAAVQTAVSSTHPTAEEQQVVIQRVAEAEQELLAAQQEKIASARQPGGPGMAKKPRTTTKPPSNSVSADNTTGTYVRQTR